MVEAELGFLQMQLELVVANAVKLRQPVLGIAPKRLNAIDVVGASSEFMVAVIDPKVLLQTEIDQAASAAPALTANAASTEIGLIGFKLAVERRLGSAILGQTSADVLVDVVDATHRQSTQPGGIAGRQIQGEQAQQLAELGLGDL
jgi:hypothetical protein